MPEPMAFVQRRIRLYGTPAQISMTVQYVPILVWNRAFLIPDPADISVLKQRCVGKDERVRLVHAQVLDVTRKVVHMTFAASTIEPELYQFAVIVREFLEFRNIVVVVLGGVFVLGLMAVPGRKIHAKPESIFSRRVRHSPHEVAATVFPGAPLQ